MPWRAENPAAARLRVFARHAPKSHALAAAAGVVVVVVVVVVHVVTTSLGGAGTPLGHGVDLRFFLVFLVLEEFVIHHLVVRLVLRLVLGVLVSLLPPSSSSSSSKCPPAASARHARSCAARAVSAGVGHGRQHVRVRVPGAPRAEHAAKRAARSGRRRGWRCPRPAARRRSPSPRAWCRRCTPARTRGTSRRVRSRAIRPTCPFSAFSTAFRRFAPACANIRFAACAPSRVWIMRRNAGPASDCAASCLVPGPPTSRYSASAACTSEGDTSPFSRIGRSAAFICRSMPCLCAAAAGASPRADSAAPRRSAAAAVAAPPAPKNANSEPRISHRIASPCAGGAGKYRLSSTCEPTGCLASARTFLGRARSSAGTSFFGPSRQSASSRESARRATSRAPPRRACTLRTRTASAFPCRT